MSLRHVDRHRVETGGGRVEITCLTWKVGDLLRQVTYQGQREAKLARQRSPGRGDADLLLRIAPRKIGRSVPYTHTPLTAPILAHTVGQVLSFWR